MNEERRHQTAVLDLTSDYSDLGSTTTPPRRSSMTGIL
jgi:hypothetical protein